jgi:nicotinate phosphoribosyltransferase
MISFLDQDFYKFTMQQLIFHKYSKISNKTGLMTSPMVKYKFFNRNKSDKLGFMIEPLYHFVNELNQKKVFFTNDEIKYLKGYSFLKEDYLNYLRNFNGFTDVSFYCEKIDDDLFLEFVGKWHQDILLEVILLYAINEIYFKSTTNYEDLKSEGLRRLDNKIKELSKYPGIKISDFGTRRRYSFEWHEEVIKRLVTNCPNFFGTSNVYFAKKYGVKSIGTMAHEYISAHLGLVNRIEDAQKRAFYMWMEEYDNNLGIALTDTFTSDAFFIDFNSVLSNTFLGLRHDSGCPFEFAEKAIMHYQKLGINPKEKTIVFSDSLNLDKTIKLYEAFHKYINVSFGIGTFLTNDLGVDSLNIVIKLVEINNMPVAKISDNEGKEIGDKKLINDIKNVYSKNKI